VGSKYEEGLHLPVLLQSIFTLESEFESVFATVYSHIQNMDQLRPLREDELGWAFHLLERLLSVHAQLGLMLFPQDQHEKTHQSPILSPPLTLRKHTSAPQITRYSPVRRGTGKDQQ